MVPTFVCARSSPGGALRNRDQRASSEPGELLTSRRPIFHRPAKIPESAVEAVCEHGRDRIPQKFGPIRRDVQCSRDERGVAARRISTTRLQAANPGAGSAAAEAFRIGERVLQIATTRQGGLHETRARSTSMRSPVSSVEIDGRTAAYEPADADDLRRVMRRRFIAARLGISAVVDPPPHAAFRLRRDCLHRDHTRKEASRARRQPEGRFDACVRFRQRAFTKLGPVSGRPGRESPASPRRRRPPHRRRDAPTTCICTHSQEALLSCSNPREARHARRARAILLDLGFPRSCRSRRASRRRGVLDEVHDEVADGRHARECAAR